MMDKYFAIAFETGTRIIQNAVDSTPEHILYFLCGTLLVGLGIRLRSRLE